MELLSQKVVTDNVVIEITVHDLSYRMGFRDGDQPVDHLYVSLAAKDGVGRRVWSTPLLGGDGRVQPFSTVSEALAEAKARIGSGAPFKFPF